MGSGYALTLAPGRGARLRWSRSRAAPVAPWHVALAFAGVEARARRIVLSARTGATAEQPVPHPASVHQL